MENGFFRIADPLNGWQFVKKDVFWQSFAQWVSAPSLSCLLRQNE